MRGRPRRAPPIELAALALLLGAASAAGAQEPVAIPEHNRADLAEPPPRPGLGDLEERARRCFEAIAAGDPSLATDFFLPRDAFRAIKAVADPDALYDRLYAAFERDVRALHEALPAGAAFVRFEPSRRRGWVRVREEANRLPYWALRHSAIVYHAGGEERRLEVRTLIAWDDRWYVTHLSEFR